MATAFYGFRVPNVGDPADLTAIVQNVADDIEDELRTGGYRLLGRIVYTSDDTFEKSDFPGLRAIDVQVQAPGHGAGGAGDHNAVGQITVAGGGGAGNYARSTLTADQLGTAESVTIGSPGQGGASRDNPGTMGGAAQFGSLVVAATGGTGGEGGQRGDEYRVSFGGSVNATAIGNCVGDIIVPGAQGGAGHGFGSGTSGGSYVVAGAGAQSLFGTGGFAYVTRSNNDGSNGNAGRGFGAGGSGACAIGSGWSGVNLAGGDGAPGIVIVKLYV
jgi:hypothetical protein